MDEPNKVAENAVAADRPDAAAPREQADAARGPVAPSADAAPADVRSPADALGVPDAERPAEQAPAEVASGEEASSGDQQAAAPEDEGPQLDWYILKVQSNREKSIADALRRRVSVEGLDEYFGQIIVPTEKVTEFKGGKRRVVQRKLYPGYILVQMVINDDTWFLVRETPGIGDFTGSGGKPTPMQPHEVHRIVSTQEEKTDEAPKLKINFRVGDRVKINEGTFENFEGEVSSLDQASGRVIVMINIFGRSTPVELEYWQVEVM